MHLPARLTATTFLLTSIAVANTADAAPPTFACFAAGGRECSPKELAAASARTIVVVPTGYTADQQGLFEADVAQMARVMTDPAEGGAVWSVTKRDQLYVLGVFVPGAALGSPGTAFGGAILPHPKRGYGYSIAMAATYGFIDGLSYGGAAVKPLAAAVLFNSEPQEVVANAAPPGFTGKAYGIARFSRSDLGSAYLATHELAHAGLNFLDEYRESGLEEVNIRQMDILTPLLLLDGTWSGAMNATENLLGTYSLQASEVIGNNGHENVALSPWPATSPAPDDPIDTLEYEGGMFFGRGTYHMAGRNLMNGDASPRGPEDGFGWAHTPNQQRVVETLFGAPAGRSNHRLRTAGPSGTLSGLQFGSEATVLLFDGDKNHHAHPTQTAWYEVGYYERNWSTCWWGWVPYACYEDVWQSFERTAAPKAQFVEVKASAAYGVSSLLQRTACAVGYSEVSGFNLCTQDLDGVADAFLPTLRFPTPYHEEAVPTPLLMTTYWWRAATHNGTKWSAETDWSSFFRSL